MPKLVFLGIGNHSRAPVLEILNAPYLHIRTVDVYPLIRKNILFVNNEYHNNKSAIREFIWQPQVFRLVLADRAWQ